MQKELAKKTFFIQNDLVFILKWIVGMFLPLFLRHARTMVLAALFTSFESTLGTPLGAAPGDDDKPDQTHASAQVGTREQARGGACAAACIVWASSSDSSDDEDEDTPVNAVEASEVVAWMTLIGQPQTHWDLLYIRRLNLSRLQLGLLPDAIGSLRTLVELNVSHNALSYLPDSIGQLTSLQTLAATDNNLLVLLSSIGGLRSLRILLLKGNLLEHLPAELTTLRRLESLSLARNLLTELPRDLDRLPRLKRLNVAHNLLRGLPVFHFRQLGSLRLTGNPFEQMVTLPLAQTETPGLMVHLSTLPAAGLRVPANYTADLDIQFDPNGPLVQGLTLPAHAADDTWHFGDDGGVEISPAAGALVLLGTDVMTAAEVRSLTRSGPPSETTQALAVLLQDARTTLHASEPATNPAFFKVKITTQTPTCWVRAPNGAPDKVVPCQQRADASS